MKIKLRPKQFAMIQALQAQKAELNKKMGEVNQNESLILELALEENGVTGQVNNVKLEGDELVFDIVVPEKKSKGKLKKLLPVADEG